MVYVVSERLITDGHVVGTGSVRKERVATNRCLEVRVVVKERVYTDRCVVGARGIRTER
jgi:hypothetical protein